MGRRPCHVFLALGACGGADGDASPSEMGRDIPTRLGAYPPVARMWPSVVHLTFEERGGMLSGETAHAVLTSGFDRGRWQTRVFIARPDERRPLSTEDEDGKATREMRRLSDSMTLGVCR